MTSFDPRHLLALLPYRPLPSALAYAACGPPPIWKWKTLPTYNGFTHEERVLSWQVGWLLRRLGALHIHGQCDLCGVTDGLTLHSEDYRDIERALTLCKPCHFAIHRRFRSPSIVRGRVGFGLVPPWATALSATPFDLAGWLRHNRPGGLLDRLPSPLRAGLPISEADEHYGALGR